ncbi:MAG: hypothetical protein Kow00109_07660 [Acidobacteriota bacterium]
MALAAVLMWAGAALSATPAAAAQEAQRKAQAEEEEDYFEKWLKEDVVYIITDEERAVFESLSTPEEKEQFIEQFWFRRDPDPTTPVNEFKEEHYRRIAYANEHFTSGDPGWRTDRGRIYIIHGPPDNIETRPMGGTYVRKIQEGGGVTSVYPYEKWTYRHIEGIGDNVELEFVDPTGTGEYKLAVNSWEKDALLQFPGAGRTLAEQTGLSTRANRPELIPAAGGAGYNPQEWYRSLTDTPFARYEKVAKVGGAPITRYPDLKELVKVDIHYETLPCRLEADFFRLNEAQDLVAATVVVANRDLTFQAEGEFQVARLGIYAVVSNMSNRIVEEFEDDLVVRYRPEELEAGRARQSVYQKIFPLERRGRHKVDLVVKDLVSGKIGVIRQALNPPPYDAEKLTLSTLLLSDRVEPLGRVPEQDEMFVIGDVKVLPRPDHEFTPGMPLGIYLQVYNAQFDQATGNPSLVVTYRLFRDGRALRQAREVNGESIYYLSTRRIVLLRNLSLDGLEPGRYEVRVEVEDQLSGQQAAAAGTFTLVAPQLVAGS